MAKIVCPFCKYKVELDVAKGKPEAYAKKVVINHIFRNHKDRPADEYYAGTDSIRVGSYNA